MLALYRAKGAASTCCLAGLTCACLFLCACDRPPQAKGASAATLAPRMEAAVFHAAPPPRPADPEAEAFLKALTWYLRQLKALDGKSELKPDDLVAVPNPAPNESKFHNRFAPRWKVVKEGLHVWPDKEDKKDVVDPKYVLSYDMNLAELAQIRSGVEAKRFSVLVPVTRRREFNGERYGTLLAALAKAYRVKEYKPEYQSSWLDTDGNEYLLFAVTEDSRRRVMIARVRKSK